MKAIIGELLIDANGIKKNTVVLIKGERIVKIGSSKDVEVPPEAEVIDASDSVLMPGMIDCHVHFEGSEKGEPLKFTESYETRLIRAAVHETRQLLESGFTSVIDAGGLVGLHVRNAINEGIIPGPRIIASGRYISVTGGHGDTHYLPLEWVKEGRPMGWWPMDGRIADGVDECIRAVREQLREGVDIIKIITSGGGESIRDPWYVPEYTFEEIKTMVHIAHSWGRRVMAHSHNPEGIRRSVLADVDVIIHAKHVDEEAIKLMLEHGTIVVSTMSWSYIENRPCGADIYKKLYDGGVTIALGTDTMGSPIPFGKNAIELECFVEEVGLNPFEAIKIGTLNGAKAMGIKDLGTIEAGKLADIIAVEKNPLEDIKSLQDKNNIKFVMKEGEIYKNNL